MKTGIFWQSYTSIVIAAKNYLAQAWSLNVLFLFLASAALAQSHGSMKIEVLNEKQCEALPFTDVFIYKDSVVKAKALTDMDGEVVVTKLEPGTYNVKAVYPGYQTRQINKVLIKCDTATYLKINLASEGADLTHTLIAEYEAPLIDDDAKTSRADFQKMAYKRVGSVVPCTGCCWGNGDPGISVRGCRREKRTPVFVDGERMIGTPIIGDPVQAPIEFKMGGLSVQFENNKVGAGTIFPNP